MFITPGGGYLDNERRWRRYELYECFLVITVVVVATFDVGTFDPFVQRNSFVAVVVTVSQKISSTFSTEFVVSAQISNFSLECLQFSAL